VSILLTWSNLDFLLTALSSLVFTSGNFSPSNHTVHMQPSRVSADAKN
jgi:hypothetical protein